MEKPLKGIALYDLQYPKHNPNLLKVVEKYLKSEKWDYLIYGGDNMDMDAISHWSIDGENNRALEGKRLKNDYKGFSEMLLRHKKLVGKKCKIYFFIGNHEENPDRFVDKHPTLEGMIEILSNLPLKEIDAQIIKPRDFLKLGKIYFIHGDINSGQYAPQNHAKKIVDIYNRNVVYGHHHSLMVHTKISPAGINETHTAFSIPCMADTNPDWAKNKPNAWINGFATFYITKNNFSVFPVVAINNSFISPEGKYYK